MKKIIYGIILASLFISRVYAFNIDIDKIDIGSKSNDLISNLSKEYKIEVNDYGKEDITIDKDTEELIIDVIKISLSDIDKVSKKKEIFKYQYISDNGGETLSTSILVDLYFDKLDTLNIEVSYIKEIRLTSFDGNVMAFVYLDEALVNKEKNKVVFVYWLKEKDGEYKIFYPWVTIGDDMDEYFNKVSNNEDNGNIYSGTYKELSLSNEKKEISLEELDKIYQDNIKSIVQITGMDNNGIAMYGGGFFIREGVIVTTWSLINKFLTESNYVYVNDSEGKTYEIDGIITADVNYDIAVLKLNEEVGIKVKLGNSDTLEVDDFLFMIDSKNNNGFSISYGKFIEQNKGILKNMFLLSEGDIGVALFNNEGEVIGITNNTKVNSELSYANSTNYLKELQSILSLQNFDNILITNLEDFKEVFYKDVNKEQIVNSIDSKVYDKYKEIGNLDETINLELVKASYVDNILSLRYKCNNSRMIDSMFFISSYTEQLISDGYKLTYDDNYKSIYENKKYKVIIKNNLQYIIILIMEK